MATVARFTAVASAHERAVRYELVDNLYLFVSVQAKRGCAQLHNVNATFAQPHFSHSMTACLWKNLDLNQFFYLIVSP